MLLECKWFLWFWAKWILENQNSNCGRWYSWISSIVHQPINNYYRQQPVSLALESPCLLECEDTEEGAFRLRARAAAVVVVIRFYNRVFTSLLLTHVHYHKVYLSFCCHSGNVQHKLHGKNFWSGWHCVLRLANVRNDATQRERRNGWHIIKIRNTPLIVTCGRYARQKFGNLTQLMSEATWRSNMVLPVQRLAFLVSSVMLAQLSSLIRMHFDNRYNQVLLTIIYVVFCLEYPLIESKGRKRMECSVLSSKCLIEIAQPSKNCSFTKQSWKNSYIIGLTASIYLLYTVYWDLWLDITVDTPSGFIINYLPSGTAHPDIEVADLSSFYTSVLNISFINEINC